MNNRLRCTMNNLNDLVRGEALKIIETRVMTFVWDSIWSSVWDSTSYMVRVQLQLDTDIDNEK